MVWSFQLTGDILAPVTTLEGCPDARSLWVAPSPHRYKSAILSAWTSGCSLLLYKCSTVLLGALWFFETPENKVKKFVNICERK